MTIICNSENESPKYRDEYDLTVFHTQANELLKKHGYKKSGFWLDANFKLCECDKGLALLFSIDYHNEDHSSKDRIRICGFDDLLTLSFFEMAIIQKKLIQNSNQQA
jgi:hypothetical protein